MNILSKLFLATTALAAISACSSEMSEDEKAIYEARKAEEAAKPTNLTAVIQENADLTTAATLVTLSGIAAELKDDGPFTTFIANNDAFKKMDDEELSAMMSGEDKTELAKIAKYGLIEGDLKAADVVKAINDGGGTASLTTLEGGVIKATLDGEKVILEDAAGNKANVIQADVDSSNGTIHIIDALLMPS